MRECNRWIIIGEVASLPNLGDSIREVSRVWAYGVAIQVPTEASSSDETRMSLSCDDALNFDIVWRNQRWPPGIAPLSVIRPSAEPEFQNDIPRSGLQRS
jgi:hypothetical protein